MKTKLTSQQVKEIKLLLSWGDTSQYEIAIAYGVSQAAISKINRGITWLKPVKR